MSVDRGDWSTVLRVASEHLGDDLSDCDVALALGYMAADADDWLAVYEGDVLRDPGAVLDSIVADSMLLLPDSVRGLAEVVRAALSAGVAAAWREMQVQSIRVQSDAELDVEVDRGP